jgi:hypothetical protein
MTNADLHVQAFFDTYGPCPVTFEALRCTVLSIQTEGSLLVVDLEWWGDDEIRHAEQWRYLDPEIWLPDPAGDVPRYEQVTDERANAILDGDGNPIMATVMGRIAPTEVAAPQLARQLGFWRQQ